MTIHDPSQYQTHMQAPKYDVQFLRSEALHSSSSSSSRTRQIKECKISCGGRHYVYFVKLTLPVKCTQYSWLFIDVVTADHTIMHMLYSNGITVWQRAKSEWWTLRGFIVTVWRNNLLTAERKLSSSLIHEFLLTVSWNYTKFCHSFFYDLITFQDSVHTHIGWCHIVEH